MQQTISSETEHALATFLSILQGLRIIFQTNLALCKEFFLGCTVNF